MHTSLVQRKAPDFQGKALVGQEVKEVSLAQYSGKWVVLFFYPLDFTFVCPTEITAFDDRLDRFHELEAEVIGCSVDSHYSHLAWSKMPRNEGGLGGVRFPLLADITKEISRSYGVLLEKAGIALRGLFIINPEGVIQFQLVHDLGIGRNVDEVLRVLEAIQVTQKTGEVCPANWASGGSTMKPDPKGSKEYFSRQS